VHDAYWSRRSNGLGYGPTRYLQLERYHFCYWCLNSFGRFYCNLKTIGIKGVKSL
jgi:hypothetical protein